MKKLSYVLTTAAAFLLSSSDLNYAIGAEQEQIDQIVSVVERLCLAGSAYRLQADAKGNLTLTKLLPGSEGSISANVVSDKGAVGYLNEEIRKKVDVDTRDCMRPYIDKIISLITGEHPSSPPPQPGPRSETINSALFPTKSANDIPADMYNEGAYENEYFTIEETRTYAYISAVIVNYRFSTKRDFKMMLAHQWWFSGKDDNGNEYRDDTGTPFGPICRLESNKCKDDQFKSYPANVDKNLWAALGIVNPDKWDKNKPKYIYVLFNFLVRDGDVTKLIQIPIKSEMGQ